MTRKIKIIAIALMVIMSCAILLSACEKTVEFIPRPTLETLPNEFSITLEYNDSGTFNIERIISRKGDNYYYSYVCVNPAITLEMWFIKTGDMYTLCSRQTGSELLSEILYDEYELYNLLSILGVNNPYVLLDIAPPWAYEYKYTKLGSAVIAGRNCIKYKYNSREYYSETDRRVKATFTKTYYVDVETSMHLKVVSTTPGYASTLKCTKFKTSDVELPPLPLID